MAKTWKNPKARRWNRESTTVRRMTVRAYKTKVRQFMRQEKYDVIPLFKGTQGYVTW